MYLDSQRFERLKSAHKRSYIHTPQQRQVYKITFCVFYFLLFLHLQNSDLLNLGTGSFSWWQINGPGCKANYDVTEPELFRPARPYNVTNCVVDYEVVEVVQASTQCILGVRVLFFFMK